MVTTHIATIMYMVITSARTLTMYSSYHEIKEAPERGLFFLAFLPVL